jgi:hypothetical protein
MLTSALLLSEPARAHPLEWRGTVDAITATQGTLPLEIRPDLRVDGGAL